MNEISISTLISILRKNLGYLIAAMLIFAVVAYSFCAFIAVPTYQAQASFIGGNGGVGTDLENRDTIQSSDVAASLALIKTYVYVLQSDTVYTKVAKELDSKYTAKQLKTMVEIAPRDADSLIIDVKITSVKPEDAVEIANTYLKVGSEHIMALVPKAYIVGMEDSTYAVQNYPNTMTTVALAVILAFVLVYGICLVASMMDKTIKGEQDFTDNYDIPVLGDIPNFKVAAKEERK